MNLFFPFYLECTFAIIQQLDCRLAMVRIKEDKPITIKDDKGDSRKLIAQIVSVCVQDYGFIT